MRARRRRPGRAPLRRLSNAEYRNTVTDLLGDSPATQSLVATATRSFPSETESLGFRNNADYLGVSTLVAQGYVDAAEQFLDPIAAEHGLSVVHAERGRGDGLRAHVHRQLRQASAFRRPLSAEESTQYAAIFEKSLKAYDFQSALRATAFAFLQSPKFLYRVEFGAAPSGSSTRPSPYEMANRLSYLFWQSMPDQSLFDAAESNQLATRSANRGAGPAHAARARRHRVLLEYFDQWLGTDTLPTTFTRDATLYPNLDPNLVPLLQQETRAFVTSVLSRPDGSLSELFTAPYTFANAEPGQALRLDRPHRHRLREGRRARPRGRADARHDARARQSRRAPRSCAAASRCGSMCCASSCPRRRRT